METSYEFDSIVVSSWLHQGVYHLCIGTENTIVGVLVQEVDAHQEHMIYYASQKKI